MTASEEMDHFSRGGVELGMLQTPDIWQTSNSTESWTKAGVGVVDPTSFSVRARRPGWLAQSWPTMPPPTSRSHLLWFHPVGGPFSRSEQGRSPITREPPLWAPTPPRVSTAQGQEATRLPRCYYHRSTPGTAQTKPPTGIRGVDE